MKGRGLWIFIMHRRFILDTASFEFTQYDDCTDLSYLFDVPSKDHMLCPYSARHEKGSTSLSERQWGCCGDEDPLFLSSHQWMYCCRAVGESAVVTSVQWLHGSVDWRKKGGRKQKLFAWKCSRREELSCLLGPVDVRCFVCGRQKRQKPARDLLWAAEIWRCTVMALLWEYNYSVGSSVVLQSSGDTKLRSFHWPVHEAACLAKQNLR